MAAQQVPYEGHDRGVTAGGSAFWIIDGVM